MLIASGFLCTFADNMKSLSDKNIDKKHSKTPMPPTTGRQRPEMIRLPFDNRRNKRDLSEWIYHHRVGLLVTVVLYLIAAIMFLSYKIVINDNIASTIYMTLVDPNEPEPVKPPEPQPTPQELERIEQAQMEKVRNVASNDNAKLNATLKDDRGSKAREIYEEAERVQQKLAAGKQNFKAGMDEVASMESAKGGRPKTADTKQYSKSDKNQDAKVEGNVTVRYSLEGRTATFLYMPAYQCKGGGTVEVTITVNRSGDVIDASATRSSAGSESCITEMAVKAARLSSFNASAAAPDKQRGTITYTFVPQ